MIRFADALRLARTKLKLRRVRLIVTVVISALLFSVLAGAAVLIQGTTTSLETFAKEGYGNRFFVQGSPQTDLTSAEVTAAVIEELKPQQAALVAQKKALARTLQLTYDEATDAALPLTAQPATEGGTPGGFSLNSENPLVQAALAARATAAKVSFEEFSSAAQGAGAIKTFRGTTSSTNRGATLAIVKEGREVTSATATGESRGLRTLVDNGLSLRDATLLTPFVLKGQDLAVGADGSIPLIAPFSAAEEMLGLKPLSTTASPEAKIQRIAKVRKGIAGTTAQLCYRNEASTALLHRAEAVMKEWAAAKGKPDAVEPPLQYALPTTPCAIPTISKDARSAEDKAVASKQETFDRTFGLVSDPVQGTVTVRIVGLSPDADLTAQSMSLTSILSGLLSSNTGAGWISPLEAGANPTVQAIFGGAADTLSLARQVYYAEFPDVVAMRAFTAAQSCANPADAGLDPGVGTGLADSAESAITDPAGTLAAGSDPTCVAGGKGFFVTPYGNSAGAIDDFTKGANTFLRWFVLAVLVLAALVMAGNIGKIIADSRRETAVFRSLGAQRLHIVQIYVTYVAIICALVAGLAITAGAGAAYALSQAQSAELSAIAVQAFNARNVHQSFSLFALNPQHLITLAGCVLGAGLLSAALPLLTNMRRNPITDMRDDA